MKWEFHFPSIPKKRDRNYSTNVTLPNFVAAGGAVVEQTTLFPQTDKSVTVKIKYKTFHVSMETKQERNHKNVFDFVDSKFVTFCTKLWAKTEEDNVYTQNVIRISLDTLSVKQQQKINFIHRTSDRN
jgi:hypothetical protein